MHGEEVIVLIGLIIGAIVGIPIVIKLLKYLSEDPINTSNAQLNSLQKWYNHMNRQQRMFLWIVSFCLIPIWLIGVIPLCILIYCKLGMNKN